jgi:hypothetical protein
MNLSSIASVALAVTLSASCTSKPGKQAEQAHEQSQVELVRRDADKSVDVMIDGKLFTTYRWPDNVYKPILYPLLTAHGTEITRGFPLKPRAGERSDHIHQVGNWLNYGNVNGYDFWGNGATGQRNPNGGQIKHLAINYPTYWHARGYGLFAANPFRAKDFTNGKEELNYTVPAGESLTLKYRILVSSGKHLTDAEINHYADDFASRY